MSDYDSKWIKWLLLGMVLGYIIGKIILVLLGIVIANVNVYAFLKLLPPGFAILGLFFVLFIYNREKEKQLGE